MRSLFAVLFVALLCSAAPVRADIALGATGPSFTKARLGGGSVSYASPSGHPTLLFLLGYDCPFCQAAAPSVEQDIAEYYEARSPGMLKVIGADMWNGTPAQMSAFQSLTGAQFPLLLNAATAPGGDLQSLYGPFDNFVILDGAGIVRYHAALRWPHGNRYHLDEIRAVLDPLVPKTAGVAPGVPTTLRLSVGPVPARGRATLRFELPAAASHLRVDVLDVNGRVVRALRDAAVTPGAITLEWDGRDDSGAMVPGGVYFAQAQAAGSRVTAKLVWLH
jgi:hypothetical protein